MILDRLALAAWRRPAEILVQNCQFEKSVRTASVRSDCIGRLLVGIRRRDDRSSAVRRGATRTRAAEDVNGLSKAGRALQKHGSRPGSSFPPATGNNVAKNAQGQRVLEDILRSPNQSIRPNRFGGQDIFDNNALRGARFGSDGNFMGFLEP